MPKLSIAVNYFKFPTIDMLCKVCRAAYLQFALSLSLILFAIVYT